MGFAAQQDALEVDVIRESVAAVCPSCDHKDIVEQEVTEGFNAVSSPVLNTILEVCRRRSFTAGLSKLLRMPLQVSEAQASGWSLWRFLRLVFYVIRGAVAAASDFVNNPVDMVIAVEPLECPMG